MAAAQHFDYLDGWRGLAIGFLLLGHFFPVPGVNLGAIGVLLFFVLSGLLMSGLLFQKQVPLGQFYQRRASRIFPAVLVFVLMMVVVSVPAGTRLDWREVVAATLFMNNYVVGQTGADAMPFGHFWSLCVEEHSYILLSLLALAARRHLASPRVLVGAAALLAGLISAFYALRFSGVDLWRLAMHSEAAGLAILASAACALVLHGRRLPVWTAHASPALAVFGILLHWWAVPRVVTMTVAVMALALAVNLLHATAPRWQALLSLLPLRKLGVWSFSLYIWQQPFYLLSKYHGLPAPLGLLMAFTCGIASFYLVEQPCRSWLNQRFARPVPAPIAEPGLPAAGRTG